MWHTLAMEFCLMLPIYSDLCAIRGIVDSMHPILVSFAGKHYHLHNTHAFKNHDTSGACAQVVCFGWFQSATSLNPKSIVDLSLYYWLISSWLDFIRFTLIIFFLMNYSTCIRHSINIFPKRNCDVCLHVWPGTQAFDRIARDPRRFEGCYQKVWWVPRQRRSHTANVEGTQPASFLLIWL